MSDSSILDFIIMEKSINFSITFSCSCFYFIKNFEFFEHLLTIDSSDILKSEVIPILSMKII